MAWAMATAKGPPKLGDSRPPADRVIGTATSANRLGELLVREKLISLQQLRHAQEEQRRSGSNLGYTLAKLGYVSDGEITSFLSTQYKLPAVNLDEYEIEPDVIKLVSKEVCDRHRIIPVSRA